MRLFVWIFPSALAACSASSPADPTASGDASSSGEGDSTPDGDPSTHDGLPDVSIDSSDAPPHNPAGNCPACQASKCLPELEACGGSQKCLEWLKCMNDCFRDADPATCQAGCTTKFPTSQGAKLAACNDSKCHDECTP